MYGCAIDEITQPAVNFYCCWLNVEGYHDLATSLDVVLMNKFAK
jgi:hypothetical protein